MARKGTLEKIEWHKNVGKYCEFSERAYLVEDLQAAKTYLENAIYYAKKATEILPENPHAYKYVGRCYEKLGDWKTAIDWYKKAIEKGENDPYLLDGLKKGKTLFPGWWEMMSVAFRRAREEGHLGSIEPKEGISLEDMAKTYGEKSESATEKEKFSFTDRKVDIYHSSEFPNIKFEGSNWHELLANGATDTLEVKESQNKRFSIVYFSNTPLTIKCQNVMAIGHYFLISNNKVISENDIGEIEDAWVLNNGIVVVIGSSKIPSLNQYNKNNGAEEDYLKEKLLDQRKLKYNIFFFDKDGKELFRWNTNAFEILACCMSSNKQYAAVAVGYPDEKIYLFDVASKKLVFGCKNPTNHLIDEIKFDDDTTILCYTHQGNKFSIGIDGKLINNIN